jgi:ribosome-associated heat shock protein Hsp15
MGCALPGSTLRLDLFLWYARLARTRSAAQAIAVTGMLRMDGRRIDRAHCPVRVGMVIAFPLDGRVRVLRVEALPTRRGPPAEARALYTALEPARSSPVDEATAPA